MTTSQLPAAVRRSRYAGFEVAALVFLWSPAARAFVRPAPVANREPALAL